MGLGTKGGGVVSAKFAHKHGAEVTITDMQPEARLKESLDQLTLVPKKLILGQHRLEDFENHDIIIKNPGIKCTNKYLRHAIKHNKQIETPISLFLKLYNKPFIGITGTKGKSYTTALTSHLLTCLGIKNIAAGNNCVSPLDYIEDDLVFVLELSSWQLHEMGIQKRSPEIANWLNFFPDHMNHYSSINEYFNDKSEIFRYQKANDFCVLPYGYTKIAELAPCNNRIFYSGSDLSQYCLKHSESTCYVLNDSLFYKNASECFEIARLSELSKKYAQHQLELTLPSICISIAYIASSKQSLTRNIFSKIAHGLNTFKGLEHRFETIYNSNHFRIINDSAASTPESAIKAIESIDNELILITGGGGHKNLDYTQLATKIVQLNIKTILFTLDEPSENLIKLFKLHKYTNYSIVSDLEKAVLTAFSIVSEDAEMITILFSPACSGSPRYTDMFVRGNTFKSQVFKILKEWGVSMS
jgi:UDP-N-acetylmuramoylalanine--D-glutamate ligase